MKDYLEKRREELKRNGESGFTLMEMLIVVAIIAILIAIAIPVFTTQLERAREATDEANIRSMYAECTAAALDSIATTDTNANPKVTVDTNGIATAVGTVTLKQQRAGLEGVSGTIDIGGISVTASDFGPGKTATITVKSNGDTPTIAIA